MIQWFEGNRVELFDLASDPGERNNIASSNPQLAKSMFSALSSWQERTAAALPSDRNPHFDPAASPRRRSRNQGGKGKGDRTKAAQRNSPRLSNFFSVKLIKGSREYPGCCLVFF
jgi:hypothetical protein